MDPTNRRHVWSFIEKFKQGRIIILTTHSMEEADILGDRICVMAHGRLRAIGNSIHLKNKFGAGYRISIMTDPSTTEQVKAIVESKVPGAILKDDSAGALLYQFPPSSMASIPQLVQWLEGTDTAEIASSSSGGNSKNNSGRNTPLPPVNAPSNNLDIHANNALANNTGRAPKVNALQWGISQTSLEDVFLKLIRDANPDGYQGYEISSSEKVDNNQDATLRNRKA